MAEYIEREVLIQTIQKDQWIGAQGKDYALCDIAEQPTADVQEIKHGYWIDKPTGRYCHIGSYCSVCQEKSGIGGIESNRHKPYCPNCGAKMDGKGDNNG